MAKKKEEIPERVSMKQVVGENIKRFRKAYVERSETVTISWGARRGKVVKAWTQEGQRELFRPFGIKWNHSTWSLTETAKRSPRADELFKLALAFNVPVWAFFVPPPEWMGARIDEEGIEMGAHHIITRHLAAHAKSKMLYNPRLMGRRYAVHAEVSNVNPRIVAELDASADD